MSYREKQYETCLVSFEESHIGVIQLNRPKAFNAVNTKMLEDAYEILMAMQEDPEVRVIVITGSDKAFAAGADLAAVNGYNPMQARDFLDVAHKTMFAIEDNHKPCIAAVRGLALGGGLELMLACDLRVIADNATLGLPEINLGIYPGAGGTQRMPRNCSIALAKQFVFTGDFFNAATADKIGLVNEVVPDADVMDTAFKLARKISRKSPLAIKEAKNALNQSMNTDIRTGCRIEQLGWSILFASEDQKEGMAAFLEKRKAKFTGK